MAATAFLFPGQGSQAVGMGRDLVNRFPEARAVFEEADEALGFSISKLCFEGPDDALRQTANTQPAILAASVATSAVLRERGVQPQFVAGHSLGEYSALVASGSIKFADAIRLVRKRGQCMQEAVPLGVGAMAALLGISGSAAQQLCEQVAQGEIVVPANLNSPKQIVIAGHAAAVDRAIEAARPAGAQRAVRLPVSAPFHCPLMEPAKAAMEADLDAVALQDPVVPLVNNWQAAIVRTADEVRVGLKQQIPNPVQWERTIRCLRDNGVSRCIEVGPGRVLAGLVRAIDRSIKTSTTHNTSSLEGIAA